MHAQTILVTPSLATKWLEKNYRNRTLVRSRVERYADDMKKGNWECTSQGIAFDCFGELVDGQHRLNAVILSGVSVEMLVVFDAPRSANIDQGMARRTGSNLYMAGYAEKGSIYTCSYLVSTVNYLISYDKRDVRRSISPMETKTFMDKYSEQLEFIKNELKQRGSGRLKGVRSASVMSAPVCAVIGGYDREKISKWYQILCTGEYEGDVEKSVLLLRNFLLNSAYCSSSVDKRNGMHKSMSSLRHFLEGNAIKKIYGEECFKIPRI